MKTEISCTRKIGLVLLIAFATVFACAPAAYAFISPATITLLAQSVSSAAIAAIVFIACNLVLFWSRVKKKKIFVYLALLCLVMGIVIGNIAYSYSSLKRLNTYEKVNSSDIGIMSYEECVKHNYLYYIEPNSSIRVFNTNEMISLLLNSNENITVLNIGNDVPIRFKNEIYIDQTTDGFKELLSKTDGIDKEKMIIVHCGGRGHTSSMVAKFLSEKGFSDIIILASNPEEVYLKMKEIGKDPAEYIKIAESGEQTPVMRISYSKDLFSKASAKDIFFFYKVYNYKDYVEENYLLNENNSIIMHDLDFNYYMENIEGNRTKHFLCDDEKECNLLQAALALNDINNRGYMVLLYE